MKLEEARALKKHMIGLLRSGQLPVATGPRGLMKKAGDMPPFLKQDRPGKVKEIYRALKRDHPDMPAEMKARIAARQGKRGKQHQGPPYKAPIKTAGFWGNMMEKRRKRKEMASDWKDFSSQINARIKAEGGLKPVKYVQLQTAWEKEKGRRVPSALRIDEGMMGPDGKLKTAASVREEEGIGWSGKLTPYQESMWPHVSVVADVKRPWLGRLLTGKRTVKREVPTPISKSEYIKYIKGGGIPRDYSKTAASLRSFGKLLPSGQTVRKTKQFLGGDPKQKKKKNAAMYKTALNAAPPSPPPRPAGGGFLNRWANPVGSLSEIKGAVRAKGGEQALKDAPFSVRHPVLGSVTNVFGMNAAKGQDYLRKMGHWTQVAVELEKKAALPLKLLTKTKKVAPITAQRGYNVDKSLNKPIQPKKPALVPAV
jgi:hypothetical protein